MSNNESPLDENRENPDKIDSPATQQDGNFDSNSTDSVLWPAPGDTPTWVVDKMPVETVAHSDLAWQLRFAAKPSWWTASHGLRVVNDRRKLVYELWIKGELNPDTK